MEKSFVSAKLCLGIVLLLFQQQKTRCFSSLECAGEISSSGYSPLKNVTINCVSYDFINITCQWQLPPEYSALAINWTFRQKLYKEDTNCTHPIAKGCTFLGDFGAKPSPCFVLTGTNSLGTSDIWYSFDHFRNVILSSPTDLNHTNITKSTAVVSWDDNSTYKNNVGAIIGVPVYKASIDYRMIIKKKNEEENTIVMITSNKSLLLGNLSSFTDYDVEIQCRFVTKGYKNSWSRCINGKFKTQPSVPAVPPSNVIADISVGLSERNVTLYWTGVPKNMQFGKNFRYSVSVACNNSEPVSSFTPNSYFAQSSLSTQLDCTYKVVAVNEVGESEEGTYFNITTKDDYDLLGLEVDDVILQENDTSVWNYTVSWKVTGDKVDFLTLYWCRGTKDTSGYIQCDESGVHRQDVVPSKEATSLISLINPTPLHHFFGVAATTTENERIVWSPCVVPTSRAPRSPQFNPDAAGPTWVYLSWKSLKCEDKSAYIVGYKLYVLKDGKVITHYPVKENVTAFNITDLTPNTAYAFAVTTTTLSSESDMKIIEVPTLQFPTPSDTLNRNAIIIAAVVISFVVVSGVLSWIGYFVHRRIRSKIAEMTNIQPPEGLTSCYEGMTADDILNAERGNSIPPLLASNKPEELLQTNQYGSGNGRYGQLMSENGAPLQAQKIITGDINNTLLNSRKPTDAQETLMDQVSGYMNASAPESPSSMPQLELQSITLRDTYANPSSYSSVGKYVTSTTNGSPPNANAGSFVSNNQLPNYVRVVGFSLTESSTDEQDHYPQQLAGSPTDLEAQSNAPNDSNFEVRPALLIPDFRKDVRKTKGEQNITPQSVGSVGYARLSVAVEPSSSQDTTDGQQLQPIDKIGYVKVSAAAEDPQSYPSSPHQQELHADSSSGCKISYSTVNLPATPRNSNALNSHRVNCTSGYKSITESNLDSCRFARNDSSLRYQPPKCTVLRAVDDPETIANPKIKGYVPAASLSTLLYHDAPVSTSFQPCRHTLNSPNSYNSTSYFQPPNTSMCHVVAGPQNTKNLNTVGSENVSPPLPSNPKNKGYVPVTNLRTLLNQEAQIDTSDKISLQNLNSLHQKNLTPHCQSPYGTTHHAVREPETTANANTTANATASPLLPSSPITKGYVTAANLNRPTFLNKDAQIDTSDQPCHQNPTGSYRKNSMDGMEMECRCHSVDGMETTADVNTTASAVVSIPLPLIPKTKGYILAINLSTSLNNEAHLDTSAQPCHQNLNNSHRKNLIPHCQSPNATLCHTVDGMETTADVNTLASVVVSSSLASDPKTKGYVSATNLSTSLITEAQIDTSAQPCHQNLNSSLRKNSMPHCQSPNATVCHTAGGMTTTTDVNTLASVVVSTSLASDPKTKGYVTAARLSTSTLLNHDAQTDTSDPLGHQNLNCVPHCQSPNVTLYDAADLPELASDVDTLASAVVSTPLLSIIKINGYVSAANLSTLLNHDAQIDTSAHRVTRT